MVKKKRKPIYLFILALIVLYLVTDTLPKLTGILEGTETLEPGTIQVTEDVTFFFVRDEKVYAADRPGNLNYLISEGTRIPYGTKVLELTSDSAIGTESQASKQAGDAETTDQPAESLSKYGNIITQLGKKAIRTTDCKSESSGIVSYYIDGYESYFTPQTMKKLNYDDVKRLRIKAVNAKRETTLKKEPIYKIADNDNWYLVCWVEDASVAKYEVGKEVTVELPSGDVKAEVKSVTEAGDRWQIIFRSNRYYKAFAKSRIVEAKVIAGDYSGLEVRNRSLTTKDGKPGLMVKQKDGDYTFRRVKIISSDGEYSVLQDTAFIDEKGNSVKTVKVYDKVLKHPGDVQH